MSKKYYLFLDRGKDSFFHASDKISRKGLSGYRSMNDFNHDVKNNLFSLFPIDNKNDLLSKINDFGSNVIALEIEESRLDKMLGNDFIYDEESGVLTGYSNISDRDFSGCSIYEGKGSNKKKKEVSNKIYLPISNIYENVFDDIGPRGIKCGMTIDPNQELNFYEAKNIKDFFNNYSEDYSKDFLVIEMDEKIIDGLDNLLFMEDDDFPDYFRGVSIDESVIKLDPVKVYKMLG